MNTTTKNAANSIVGKLTAGILAAAAVLPAPALALQPAPDRALVIGDSLEVGSGPYLRGALPGVRVDAKKGRTSSEGVGILASRLAPSDQVIVFPLGTNDSPSTPAVLASDFAAVRRLAGDRCIVVATIARPPLGGVSVAGINRVVQQFAAQAGAQVVDWQTVVRSIPSLLGPDRVHATGEGYSLRAGLIAEAVQSCGAGTGVSGIPAPRDPNARVPRGRRAPSPETAATLPVDAGASFVAGALTRAVAPVGAALRAARTAATRAGPEPVLGAP
jgi:lysophospholipase L1-like esterase